MEKSHRCNFKNYLKKYGILTKLKHLVPENILYSLYCTLILPYTDYGVLIWGNTSKIYLDKISKLQKWSIKRYQIATIEATLDHCSQNLMFLM